MGGTRGEPRGVLHALRLELVLLWARVQNVRMSPCGCAEICAGADNCHFTCAHKRHCIRMHMPERAVRGHCICNVNHTGLSECLISMFALLQKTSFIHFVPIICGYFHVIGVGNIYGRFHTLMFYSWLRWDTKEEITCFCLFSAHHLNISFFCVGRHGRVVVYLQTCDIRSVL